MKTETKTIRKIQKDSIIKVITVYKAEEANEYLSSGWVLLSTGAVHLDKLGYQAAVYFTLAEMKP